MLCCDPGVPPVSDPPMVVRHHPAPDAGLLPADPHDDPPTDDCRSWCGPGPPPWGSGSECGCRPGCRSRTWNASPTEIAAACWASDVRITLQLAQAALVSWTSSAATRSPATALTPPMIDDLDTDRPDGLDRRRPRPRAGATGPGARPSPTARASLRSPDPATSRRPRYAPDTGTDRTHRAERVTHPDPQDPGSPPAGTASTAQAPNRRSPGSAGSTSATTSDRPCRSPLDRGERADPDGIGLAVRRGAHGRPDDRPRAGLSSSPPPPRKENTTNPLT